MRARPLSQWVLTPHAAGELRRRGLDEETIRMVLSNPEQASEVRPGRIVLQSRVTMEGGKLYLVRVFVDVDRQPPEVVTAYRTSKIAKYWRTGP